MREIDIQIVDAFTTTPLTGNPAGVVKVASGLSDDDCQRIAAELNLSETAFVLPSDEDGADFRVRFFTPRTEVDLCGHATIATFWALAAGGDVELDDGENRFVQQTNVGNLPVWIEVENGAPVQVMMGQKAPVFETPEINLDKIAALFGIGRKHISEDLPAEIVSTGMRSLHIPIVSLACFPEIKVHRRGVVELSTALDVTTVQLFTLETSSDETHAHCRVFGPAVGIDEDPVTGTAAGSLGAYLVKHKVAPDENVGLTRIAVEQGLEIGRPGIAYVRVSRGGDEITGVRVGGAAFVSLTGTLRL